MPSSYTIGEHYEQLVKRLVEEGRYASASEVIRAGLRLLEEAEAERAVKLAELRRLIQEGDESGPGEEWNLEETRRRLHEQFNNRQRAAE